LKNRKKITGKFDTVIKRQTNQYNINIGVDKTMVKQSSEQTNFDLSVKTVTLIEDGKHSGVFSNVLSRTTKVGADEYTYISFEIALLNIKKQDGRPVILNLSAPANLTCTPDGAPSSKLAKILDQLKISLKNVGSVENLRVLLKGKPVVFQTISKTNINGTFAEILPETVRLE